MSIHCLKLQHILDFSENEVPQHELTFTEPKQTFQKLTSAVVSFGSSSSIWRISLTASPNFSLSTRSIPIFIVVVELGQLPHAPINHHHHNYQQHHQRMSQHKNCKFIAAVQKPKSSSPFFSTRGLLNYNKYRKPCEFNQSHHLSRHLRHFSQQISQTLQV